MGRTGLVVLLSVVFLALLFGSSTADTGLNGESAEAGQYTARGIEDKEDTGTAFRKGAMSWSEVEDSYSENAENWKKKQILRESKETKSED